jgi:hypothetical protein
MLFATLTKEVVMKTRDLNIDLSPGSLEKVGREDLIERFSHWTYPQYRVENPNTKIYIFKQNMFSKPIIKGPDFVARLRESGVFQSGSQILPNGIMKIDGEDILVCPTKEGTTTVMDALKMGGMQSPAGGVVNGLFLSMPILVIPNQKSWEAEVGSVKSHAVVARLAGAYYKYTGKKII